MRGWWGGYGGTRGSVKGEGGCEEVVGWLWGGIRGSVRGTGGCEGMSGGYEGNRGLWADGRGL